MGNLIIFYFPVVFFLHFVRSQRIFTVETSAGRVNGRIVSVENAVAGVFLGIPYAEPPVFELRFAPPVPPRPWNPGVWNASGNFRSMCPQNPGYDPGSQSEDCLYLNVFTPKISAFSREKFPVMFWIHGGGFKLGGANDYPTDGIIKQFVSRRVVVVTINYRLGALGFWASASPTDGNNGILDQLLALRWVNREIDNFGGDPKRLTIFGESAGAISVSILQMSPLARGLFQQAIEQSGTALNQRVAVVSPKDLYESSTALASRLRCRWPTSMDTVRCMQKIPLQLIVSSTASNQPMTWAPVFNNSVLPDEPKRQIRLRQNARTVLMGTNKDESGLLLIMPLLNQSNPELLRSLVRSPQDMREKTFPQWINADRGFLNPAMVRTASEYEYIDRAQPPTGQQADIFWFDRNVKFMTDMLFTGPAALDAVTESNRGITVYVYQWSYISRTAMSGFPWKGAFHASELEYLFDTPAPLFGNFPHSSDAEDQRIKDLLADLWTNFAKSGTPTPVEIYGEVWRPYFENGAPYFDINTSPQLKWGYGGRAAAFWNGFVESLESIGDPCVGGTVNPAMPLWLYASFYC